MPSGGRLRGWVGTPTPAEGPARPLPTPARCLLPLLLPRHPCRAGCRLTTLGRRGARSCISLLKTAWPSISRCRWVLVGGTPRCPGDGAGSCTSSWRVGGAGGCSLPPGAAARRGASLPPLATGCRLAARRPQGRPLTILTAPAACRWTWSRMRRPRMAQTPPEAAACLRAVSRDRAAAAVGGMLRWRRLRHLE